MNNGTMHGLTRPRKSCFLRKRVKLFGGIPYYALGAQIIPRPIIFDFLLFLGLF